MMAYLMRLAIATLLMAATAVGPQSGDKGPVFTNDGSLVLPAGFRSWVLSKFRSTNKRDSHAILVTLSSVFLRFALGFSFLSAVGDRFGLWGSFGEHHVALGTFARFVAYTGQLNWFLPKGTTTTIAIVSTFAETILGFLLLLGWQTRTAALLSGVLLLLFAVTMAGALGIKAPLDFSVFSASGGAFLLASCTEFPFSIDRLRRDSSGQAYGLLTSWHRN